MSNARKAALMAIFAAIETRAEDEKSAAIAAPAPWDRGARPIEVDLLALRRSRRKAPA